jgi:hypothetical protein
VGSSTEETSESILARQLVFTLVAQPGSDRTVMTADMLSHLRRLIRWFHKCKLGAFLPTADPASVVATFPTAAAANRIVAHCTKHDGFFIGERQARVRRAEASDALAVSPNQQLSSSSSSSVSITLSKARVLSSVSIKPTEKRARPSEHRTHVSARQSDSSASANVDSPLPDAAPAYLSGMWAFNSGASSAPPSNSGVSPTPSSSSASSSPARPNASSDRIAKSPMASPRREARTKNHCSETRADTDADNRASRQLRVGRIRPIPRQSPNLGRIFSGLGGSD